MYAVVAVEVVHVLLPLVVIVVVVEAVVVVVLEYNIFLPLSIHCIFPPRQIFPSLFVVQALLKVTSNSLTSALEVGPR